MSRRRHRRGCGTIRWEPGKFSRARVVLATSCARWFLFGQIVGATHAQVRRFSQFSATQPAFHSFPPRLPCAAVLTLPCSTQGPTTYFGPAVFTAGFNMSFEVNFEDDASMAVGQESSMLNISTAGTWSLGSHTGTVSFAANSWHTVSVSYAASQTVTVDGKVLFSGAGKLSASASPIKLQLSRYVFASWDNFAIVAA